MPQVYFGGSRKNAALGLRDFSELVNNTLLMQAV